MAEKPNIIPCSIKKEWSRAIIKYAEELRAHAHLIGTHGLDEAYFKESGLFNSAIERIRGQRSATTNEKYGFINTILEKLKSDNYIKSFTYVGQKERHDYEIIFDNDYICCLEAKGCLDGNNTNIFQRPPNANEFVIWSLCQNGGSDPKRNAFSGIHTRLSAEIIAKRERVDGLLIWDPLCGTLARSCPKLDDKTKKVVTINSKMLPPPCIYLFPSTIPDARNNPTPRPWNLSDVRLLNVLCKAFYGKETDAVKVAIEVKMSGSDTQRRTIYTKGKLIIYTSNWTTVRRAK